VFEIKNLGRTALNFHVAHKLQSVAAGAAKSFDVEDIGEGMLRIFNSDKGVVLKAKTDEAEAKLNAALTGPRKKKSFSVTGNNHDSLTAALLEDARGRVREVVDEKNPDKGGVDKGRFITDPANPKLPSPNDPAPQSQDETPPATPPGGQDAAPPPPPAVVEHEQRAELTPAQQLLAEENNPEVDLALKDLKRRAKEILGDDFPSGNVGRDDIVSALRTKV
jgi:hypothetical protein